VTTSGRARRLGHGVGGQKEPNRRWWTCHQRRGWLRRTGCT
jgi:hypothetical protein